MYRITRCAPLRYFEDGVIVRNMYAELGELLIDFPKDTPVVMTISEKLKEDGLTGHAIKIIECDVQSVQHDLVHVSKYDRDTPVMGEVEPVSRATRFIQFCKGI